MSGTSDVRKKNCVPSRVLFNLSPGVRVFREYILDLSAFNFIPRLPQARSDWDEDNYSNTTAIRFVSSACFRSILRDLSFADALN